MASKTAIITGITGQDGSYLAELLLSKGYGVVGVIRRSSVDTRERIRHLNAEPNLRLVEGDVTDATGIFRLVQEYQPDEIYNLAAQSHVATSFNQPATTFEIDAMGPLHILEAIRQCCPTARFYQASTSEMLGDTTVAPQNEDTPLRPRSPYGIAKLAAHHAVRVYQEAYGLFAAAGILFNHSSPRRGLNFVTRKITQYAAHISRLALNGEVHKVTKLNMGNLDSKRDWGHARDYVRAMWLMLQQTEPKDYVIATGQTRTVREFLEIVFQHLGLNYEPFVNIDPSLIRPAEVNLLCGDSSKARRELGWVPGIGFDELVGEMLRSDMAARGVDWRQLLAAGRILGKWVGNECRVS